MGWYLRKFGAVPATREAAKHVLDAGYSLAVFPGGNFEATRPFTERHRTDFCGKKGWTEIARSLQSGAVIPVSIVGSHSLNPVLLRSERLSRLLILPALIKVRWFPVTVSQLLLAALTFFFLREKATMGLSLIAAYCVFVSTPLTPIWPTKVKIKIGKPMDLSNHSSEECYEAVQDAIQAGMDELNGYRKRSD
jgi:1-acyl-sn-glycerol-3-phosphate acyltransferase